MDSHRELLRCGRRWESAEGSSAPADVRSALLGHEARYAPDRSFDTLHVKLDLTVDMRRKALQGTCSTSIRAIHDKLDYLEFDARGLRILGARVEDGDGAYRAKHSYEDGTLRLKLRRRARSGDELQTHIRYRVEDPPSGLHFVPGKDQTPSQMWTQGQPEDSRFWYPCHDSPHEKATSEIVAIVPEGFVAVSNGVLIERKDAGSGRTSFHWRMDHPHSLYLVTLTVGRFAEVKDRWNDVPVTIWCEKGREADAKRGLGKTVKAIEFFSSNLGVPYAYPKYDQVIVREFFGGMENTTATTMLDACLIDKRAALDTDVDLLMAHELAHQWFGDLLTCREWPHAWLNEGFATYFETLFTLHDKGQDEFDYELHRNAQAYFHEDRDRYRRPVVSNHYKNPWVLFDRHLYEKGGWVLHMLRVKLGGEAWWKAMGHYVRKHKDGSVTTEDLIAALQESTGRNFKAFFDQWVFRAGYPALKARYGWKQRGKTASIQLLQTQPVSESVPPFVFDIGLRFAGRGWVKTFKRKADRKEHRWDFRLPGEPRVVELDHEHFLLKTLQFTKPHALWLNQLAQAPRALSRSQAAHEVARWGDARTVGALKRALAKEQFWGAASEMASALASIRTPAAFNALKSFSRHRDPKVRRAVVRGLAEFRSPETARLLSDFARKDASIHVEAEAARGLGSLRDPRVIPLLKRKLSSRSYWDVVATGALHGLVATREPSVLTILLRLSRESRPGGPYSDPLRLAAVRSLGAFASTSRDVVPHLCGLVNDPDERIGVSAVDVLGRCEDERALATLERLRDKSESVRIRTHAEESVARLMAGAEPRKPARRARSTR